jgi:signal transduction histidine kinase
LTPDLPPVLGNASQLQQVLLNLVINAADAVVPMDPSSRRIEIVSRLLPGGVISIVVRDSGVGVFSTDVNRLFEPFFTTKPDGTGMGLPMCKSIIEAYGGRIWAESDGHSGSAFQFTLPVMGDSLA